MRRISLFALLALIAAPLYAQTESVTYALPSTTLRVEVEAVRTHFFAGPYAAYAKKYLGIDVREKDGKHTSLTSVSVEPLLEADMSARYTVPATRAAEQLLTLSAQGLVSFASENVNSAVKWRFSAPVAADFSSVGVMDAQTVERRATWKEVTTDTSFTRVPVYEEVQVDKTVDQLAREAADIVLKARKERFNITVGNTDATYSGEALGAAISELTRMEQEYLTLFIGYSVTEPVVRTFDITPVPGRLEYPVFRVSDVVGILAPSEGPGTLYTLVLAPEAISAPGGTDSEAGRATSGIYYRTPAICTVSLQSGPEVLVRMRTPVYQLGEETFYPLVTNNKK